MNADTSEFRALRDQVGALEAEVGELRRAVVWASRFADASYEDGYSAGRAGILGSGQVRPPRIRHLRPVDGGAS